jgi:hypothetical protein
VHFWQLLKIIGDDVAPTALLMICCAETVQLGWTTACSTSKEMGCYAPVETAHLLGLPPLELP